MTVLGPTL